MEKNKRTWGFLRETKEKAIKAGVDKDTGLIRTGLDEYLEVIFPGRTWIHDKVIGLINGKSYKCRPDYRCENPKLIIEFDGLPHYTNPDVILGDIEKAELYESAGYKVIRIPYFIQLSNSVIKEMFGVEVEQSMFDESKPSLGVKGRNTPAYLCPLGIKRMAKEFRRYPSQYDVNVKALKDANNPEITGVDILEKEYNML